MQKTKKKGKLSLFKEKREDFPLFIKVLFAYIFTCKNLLWKTVFETSRKEYVSA